MLEWLAANIGTIIVALIVIAVIAFVVRDGFRVVQAIQVCYLLGSSDTREREICGIRDAMDTYHLLEGTIVTNTHEEEVKYGDKIIHILPAWKWLHF